MMNITSLPYLIVAFAMRTFMPYGGDVPVLARALVDSGATQDEIEWLSAMAFREGSFRLNVVGDGGRARCVYQLHHAPVAVLTDADLCTKIALQRFRDSRKLCPQAPLASYAGAKCGSALADRISRDRRRVADRMFNKISINKE